VITVRVSCPADLVPLVEERLRADTEVSSLVIHRGASIEPPGDVFEVDVPREMANFVVDDLLQLGVQERGTIQLLPVATWISRPGLEAEQRAPGESNDAVVWADVIERAYDESRLTWTYASFMILATLLAAIAILTDSVILIIGAMVLGPEFVAIAALGVGMVRRRMNLFGQAARTLVLGFTLSIAATAALAAVARAAGAIEYNQLLPDARPGTGFIYNPGWWSLIIALIAGSAGVLALTSARSGGLVGVFISVTTIPASGNIALALVFGIWAEVIGSAITLVVNIIGMAIAGWFTLWLQQQVWARVNRSRARRAPQQPARP